MCMQSKIEVFEKCQEIENHTMENVIKISKRQNINWKTREKQK